MNTLIHQLFDNQAHFGHSKRYRTPQLKKYIYTTQHGIDIINLDFTNNQILEAKTYLRNLDFEKILVVSNRNFDTEKNIETIAKWKPGYISNFKFGKLNQLPQTLIIDKVAYNHSLIAEAKKAGIKTIGICDTNTPYFIFKDLDFHIIVNDDNNKCISLLLTTLLS